MPHHSVDPYIGHEGHLTDTQQKSLAEFKVQLKNAGLYQPGTETAASLASDSDTTLLRFLRASHFNVPATVKRFTQTVQWRKEHDVDNLYANFDHDELEAGKRCYPHWTGRRAKNGCPLYVYCIAELGPLYEEYRQIPAEQRYQRMIVLHELMVRFTIPVCSHLPHPSSPTPIPDTFSIIDLKNVSLRTLWKFYDHMQISSDIATSHYPETLNTVVVVNVPFFFSTIWGWLKGWFDEGTRKKFIILSTSYTPLTDLIDPSNIPEMYGGKLDWQFVDPPKLEEDIKGLIGEMPVGPAVFVDGQVKRFGSHAV